MWRTLFVRRGWLSPHVSLASRFRRHPVAGSPSTRGRRREYAPYFRASLSHGAPQWTTWSPGGSGDPRTDGVLTSVLRAGCASVVKGAPLASGSRAGELRPVKIKVHEGLSRRELRDRHVRGAWGCRLIRSMMGTAHVLTTRFSYSDAERVTDQSPPSKAKVCS